MSRPDIVAELLPSNPRGRARTLLESVVQDQPQVGWLFTSFLGNLRQINCLRPPSTIGVKCARFILCLTCILWIWP
jgi:hypothetical protein